LTGFSDMIALRQTKISRGVSNTFIGWNHLTSY
jgi:hypothetical protein